MDYRQLTEEEIAILEDNSCHAEDWTTVTVGEGFRTSCVRNVNFYGDVRIGATEKSIEVTNGFFKQSGIYNATLRNVTIGDNCLIENIANYINCYDIGDDCQITGTSTVATTEGATFGQGNVISVLNEVGEGNVMLFEGLTSQIASLMLRHQDDTDFNLKIREMIKLNLMQTTPERGQIGDRVKITNTTEIMNAIISDDCEIVSACRLSDCTIKSIPEASVYIGSGVIIENSIIFDGSSILNSAKIENCFVGEACQITNGFTAESSLFFANSYMANGEACAAFCGPFTASHHKSSLLIGGQFSFYNAGSATNFSNHAYKMGPMHYGTLERGCKTASGAYLLMPAHIGTFSVCFGKLMFHPDTRSLPFSYLIALGDIMYLVPGRNITTVGLYRDIRKWPKRDVRPRNGRKSIVNFDWLQPFSVGEILHGKQILEQLREASGDEVSTYNYHEYVIKSTSLHKGIKYYDIALRIFMGAVLKRHPLTPPESEVGLGQWCDIGGELMPYSEELKIIDDIKDDEIATVGELLNRLDEIDHAYGEMRWTWAWNMMCQYYGINEITADDAARIREDYITARRAWIAEIEKDALKEYSMGDVEQDVLDNFIEQLHKERDYE
jgi:carbonic anhydrase/acetyltransferase-like protein (isoleucine patch superfamily)